MFVPLPLPFVLPRTASELRAWRLKSPPAARALSGKLLFLSLSYTHRHIHTRVHPGSAHAKNSCHRCCPSTWRSVVFSCCVPRARKQMAHFLSRAPSCRILGIAGFLASWLNVEHSYFPKIKTMHAQKWIGYRLTLAQKPKRSSFSWRL